MDTAPRVKGDIIDGRYVIESVLGSGGMAWVYRAHDRHLGRRVALKQLRPQMAAMAARFEREAQAAGALQHPAVVKVFGYGTPKNGAYIVFEYVEGETLDAMLARTGPMGAKRAAHLLRPVIGALADAHRAGVIHRDLKPENLIVQRGGGLHEHVRLLDFGIAAIGEGASRLTVEGEVFGTPCFMAPEQARGHSVTPAADVWALGVILYELSTGTLPFQGRHHAATLYQVVNEPTPPLPANVDRRMARLIERCLQKAPTDRPASAEQVLRELDVIVAPTATVVSSGPSTPAPVSERPEPSRPLGTRRSAVAGFAAALGLAIGLGAGFGFGGASPTGTTTQAVPPPPAPPADEALSRPTALLAAKDADGVLAWLDGHTDAGSVGARARLKALALAHLERRVETLVQLEAALAAEPGFASDPQIQAAALALLPHRKTAAVAKLLGGALFEPTQARLKTAVEKGNNRARWRAVEAIELGGGDVAEARVTAYIRNLRSSACDVRLKAVRALEKAGDRRAIKPIQRMQSAENFISNRCMDGADARALRKLRKKK